LAGESFMNLEEKTIRTTLIHRGNFLVYENLEVLLPDGNVSSRDVLRHPGGVAILAYTEENKVLLAEQYRKALDEVTLEIPAGKIDNGENPLETAIRELEEETGYKSDNMTFLGKIATAPGFCDEYLYIYSAKDLKKGIKQGDEDEFINVREYFIDELKEMIKQGIIKDSKTLAALLYTMI